MATNPDLRKKHQGFQRQSLLATNDISGYFGATHTLAPFVSGQTRPSQG